MRQLFVPACVCLIALTGTIADDPKMSLEQFTARRPARATDPDTAAPERDVFAPHETAFAVAPIGAADEARSEARIDAPIAVPMQSDAAQTMITEATPLPKAKPEIKPVIYRSVEEVCDTLTRAARSNNLPVAFFIRLLFQESQFSPAVVSSAGAQGIAQFMPETATDMGVDNPFDPAQAIPASARLLRNLFDRFGNLGLAAAAYNAGPKRIQDWLAKKGSLPQETQGYVKTITGRPAENWKATENGTPAVKLPRHAPCQDAAGLLAWDGPEQIPVPSIAPHRRPPAPAVIVAQAKPADGKGESKAETKSQAKAEMKSDMTIARRDDQSTATITVADASGANVRHIVVEKEKAEKPAAKTIASKTAASKTANAKKADPTKKVVQEADAPTKIGKSAGKGALQLAARQQNKNQPKKVRVSQR